MHNHKVSCIWLHVSCKLKINYLQAHNASHREAFWDCRSAFFGLEITVIWEKKCIEMHLFNYWHSLCSSSCDPVPTPSWRPSCMKSCIQLLGQQWTTPNHMPPIQTTLWRKPTQSPMNSTLPTVLYPTDALSFVLFLVILSGVFWLGYCRYYFGDYLNVQHCFLTVYKPTKFKCICTFLKGQLKDFLI